MKIIPKKDLILLLLNYDFDLVTSETIERLFDSYGDTYYRDRGAETKWELCETNENRKELLKDKSLTINV